MLVDHRTRAATHRRPRSRTWSVPPPLPRRPPDSCTRARRPRRPPGPAPRPAGRRTGPIRPVASSFHDRVAGEVAAQAVTDLLTGQHAAQPHQAGGQRRSLSWPAFSSRCPSTRPAPAQRPDRPPTARRRPPAPDPALEFAAAQLGGVCTTCTCSRLPSQRAPSRMPGATWRAGGRSAEPRTACAAWTARQTPWPRTSTKPSQSPVCHLPARLNQRGLISARNPAQS